MNWDKAYTYGISVERAVCSDANLSIVIHGDDLNEVTRAVAAALEALHDAAD